jgi:hypothetical protein
VETDLGTRTVPPAALVEAVDAGESIGVVAERLGVSLPLADLADLAHSHAAANLERPVDVRAKLGRVHEAEEPAAMVEALGGEEEVESLAEELAQGFEGGRPVSAIAEDRSARSGTR